MANGTVTTTGVLGTGVLYSPSGLGNATIVVGRVVSQAFLGANVTAGNATRIVTGVSGTSAVYNVVAAPVWTAYPLGTVHATAGIGTVTAQGFNFKHYLYPYVYNQIPEYIRTQNPQFVKFIEAYYRYLDGYGKANDILLNSGSWTDIDSTLDAFVIKLRNQFASDFPNTTIVEGRRFIKQVHEFYESKGTEQSIEMFFRVLYNDNVIVQYPGTNILRASDGRWKRDISLKLDTSGHSGNKLFVYFGEDYTTDQGTDRGYVFQIGNNTNPFDLIEKKVTIRYWEIIPGVGSVHQHFTTNILDVKKTLNPVIYDLIVDIDPTRVILDQATVEFGNEVYGVLTRQLLSYKVITPGVNFFPSDVLYINQAGTIGEYFASNYQLNPNTTLAYVNSNAINNGILRVSTTDISNGVLTATIVNTGYLFQSGKFQVTLSGPLSTGPTTLEFTTGFIYQHPGIFTNSSGLLSDACRLQDNLFYQAYSYVVKTKIDPTIWKDSYIQAVHPAGVRLFSEYIIEDNADLRSTLAATDDTRDTLHGLVAETYTSETLAKALGKIVDAETVIISTSVAKDLSVVMATEIATTSDGVSKLYNKVVAENVTQIDNFSRVVQWYRNFTETPHPADAMAFAVGKTLTDIATSGEVVQKAFSKALADSITHADSNFFSVGKNIADTAHPTDIKTFTVGKSLIDTTHPTEVMANALSKSLTDTAHPTDSFAKSISKSLTDSTVTSDLLTTAVTHPFANETLHPTDVLLPTVTWSRNFTESVVSSDGFTRTVTFARSFTETVAKSDSTSINTGKALTDSTTSHDSGVGYMTDYLDPTYGDLGYVGITFSF